MTPVPDLTGAELPSDSIVRSFICSKKETFNKTVLCEFFFIISCFYANRNIAISRNIFPTKRWLVFSNTMT